MRGLAVLVFALGGCERVLNLVEVQPAKPDAPFFTCAGEATPSFLCADFDETPAQIYELGQPTALPAAQAGATAELRAPATSPPGALWIDSQTATYVVQETGIGAPATKIHASFALQITRAPSYAFELVEIGATGAATGACSVDAQVNAPDLRMLVICDGNRLPAQRVLAGVPVGWIRVTLDLDTTAATAAMSVDGATPVMLDLSARAPKPGLPRARAGVLYAQANGGPAIALDDLQVTTTP